MVTLNGGFLSRETALERLNKANIILNNKYNITVTNPTRNISVKKKIIYLMENN